MNEPAQTAEIIEADIVRKHKQYLGMFRNSLASAAMALYGIRQEETYIADGYTTFEDFVVDELGVGKTQAYILANEGPLFSMLEDRPDGGEILEAITTAEQLRPIYKMAPDRQVLVLQMAVEKAGRTRANRPLLTRKLVEEVAAEHFNWTPGKKPARERTAGDKPAGLRFLERRFKDISEAGLTPEEAVETYGDVWDWDYFENALEFMRQCRRFSGDRPLGPEPDDAEEGPEE